MSTMMSESELDILDETDTMDEYYDDDDVMYTSSANASQDFGRLSIPMAHTSSTSVLIPSVKPTPKKNQAIEGRSRLMFPSNLLQQQQPPTKTRSSPYHKFQVILLTRVPSDQTLMSTI